MADDPSWVGFQSFPESPPVIEAKLRPGAVLIVDYVLRHGRVLDHRDSGPSTRGVRELSRLSTTDPGWVTTLPPIRDGLPVALRRRSSGDTNRVRV